MYLSFFELIVLTRDRYFLTAYIYLVMIPETGMLSICVLENP